MDYRPFLQRFEAQPLRDMKFNMIFDLIRCVLRSLCVVFPPLSDSLTLAAVGVEVRYGGQGLFMVVCLDFVDIVPIHEEGKKKVRVDYRNSRGHYDG